MIYNVFLYDIILCIVDTYSITSVDICVGSEISQDFFQIAASGSSEEAGIVIRLEIKKKMVIISSVYSTWYCELQNCLGNCRIAELPII
jgi:hypothetical protein